MGVRVLSAAAAVLLLAACNSSGQADDTGSTALTVAPTAACADAPQLRQRATEDRQRRLEASSDQARLLLASRANFLASLAVVADLQCVVTLPEAEEALQSALETARNAEGTTGFYAQAAAWTEANLAATRVIEILVQRLSPRIEDDIAPAEVTTHF